MEHRITVASTHIISSLGFGVEENFDAMLRGETGIRLVADSAIYPEPFQAGLIDRERFEQLRAHYHLRKHARFDSLAIAAVAGAMEKLNYDLPHMRTLLVLSTTKGNIDFLQRLSKKALSEKNAEQLAPACLWKSAQNVADYFGIIATPVVVSNACVSGVSAVDVAARMLRQGACEHAVVVGADLVSAFTVSGFQSFKSISPQPCKPYDAERDGLSIGEGAGCVILARNSADRGKFYILGGATSNDANHISGPSRTGDGLHLAIERAIAEAGIEKGDIDFLNLHGTATVFNDEMESKALALSALSHVPTVGYKGYIGHTLGASGIMELVLDMEALQRGHLPATRGFSRLGTPEAMNITTENRRGKFRTFVKTASGFGGFNSAVVVSASPRPSPKKGELACTNGGRAQADSYESGIASESGRTQPQAITQKLAIANSPFFGEGRGEVCCRIFYNRILINNKFVFEDPDYLPTEDFLKAAFKHLEEPNMKFYKMDNLCKLCYLAAEYLLKYSGFAAQDKRRVAVLLGNSASSLDTDIDHQLTIRNRKRYFPSPAVFVYTLPNIAIGEICIKEKFQGEVQCFVAKDYNEALFRQYAAVLLARADTDAVLWGWVDCLEEEYRAECRLMMASEP